MTHPTPGRPFRSVGQALEIVDHGRPLGPVRQPDGRHPGAGKVCLGIGEEGVERLLGPHEPPLATGPDGTVVTDNACVSSFPGPGQSILLHVKLDGTAVRSFDTVSQSPTWLTVPLEMGPGAPTARTLTVAISHGCDVSGSFTLNSLAVDVVGYR